MNNKYLHTSSRSTNISSILFVFLLFISANIPNIHCQNTSQSSYQVDTQTKCGGDILTHAKYGDFNGVHCALMSGDKVDKKDEGYGWTALMYAATHGHTNIVTYLLKCKANVNEKGNKGETALMLASITPRGLDSVKILVKHGADLDIVNDEGLTALMYAIANKNKAIEDYLKSVKKQ